MWNFVTPQLWVPDVAEAQAWYRDVLGFEVTWVRPDFGAVTCGRSEIFFARGRGPVQASVCCVRVDDADELYETYVERGVKIVEPIASQPWGVREFTLEDPHGHRFRIGHSIPVLRAGFR